MKLSEEGPDRTRIDWSGRFEPVGDADLAAMMEGIYQGGILFMQKHFGQPV